MCQKLIRLGIVSAAPVFVWGIFAANRLVAADRPEPQVHLVEEIVAKVNGEIVTRGELEQRREIIESDLRQTQGLSGEALNSETNKRVADALRDEIDQLIL